MPIIVIIEHLLRKRKKEINKKKKGDEKRTEFVGRTRGRDRAAKRGRGKCRMAEVWRRKMLLKLKSNRRRYTVRRSNQASFRELAMRMIIMYIDRLTAELNLEIDS